MNFNIKNLVVIGFLCLSGKAFAFYEEPDLSYMTCREVYNSSVIICNVKYRAQVLQDCLQECIELKQECDEEESEIDPLLESGAHI